MLMRWVILRFFLQCVLAIPAVLQADAKLYTEVGEILTLSPEEAAQEHPVELDATIIYFDHGTLVCFVHDGVNSIFLSNVDRAHAIAGLDVGDRIHLKGVTNRGDFLPSIYYRDLQKLDSPGPPPALAVNEKELMEPAADCKWVEFDAVMKSFYLFNDHGVVDLEVAGRTVTGMLAAQVGLSKPPPGLLERPLRVRCVAVCQFNDQRQMCGRTLYIPSLDCIIPKFPAIEMTDAPLVKCDSLLNAHSALGELIRVKGAVTYIQPGAGFWIYGDSTGLFVQAAAPEGLATGDEIEAVGYAAFAPFRPKLNGTLVTRTGRTLPVSAIPLDAPFNPSGPLHGSVVTLEAEYLGKSSRSEVGSLLCSAADRTFEVITPAQNLNTEPLEKGTRLKLTGIYGLKSTHPLGLSKQAEAFQIQLRGPADLTILSRPPWWSTRRAIWVIGAVLGLAALTAIWAVMMRAQVRKQSSIIAQQTVQQATLEERHRIARDLHDTLEQDLMGVSLLLDNAAAKLVSAPVSANGLLEIARRLLKRSREESRSTICDLRSVTLDQLGLPEAIREVLQPLADAAGMKLVCNFQEPWLQMPRQFENALFRVAREAASNAAHHSGGKTITVTLSTEADRVRLTIEDDGAGFERGVAHLSEASFGLQGMEERVNAIQGHLEIDSNTNTGTRITVTLRRTPKTS